MQHAECIIHPSVGGHTDSLRPRAEPEYLALLKKYDPRLFAACAEWDRVAELRRELDEKTSALILVALDSIIHRPGAHVFRNVHDAFDAGATVSEIVELIVRVGLLEGGIHSIREGMTALERVVTEREASGGSVPPRATTGGAPSGRAGASDNDPDSYYPVSATAGKAFGAWREFDPNLHGAYFEFLRKRSELRRDLSAKTEELVVAAVDSAILWPTLDFHFNEAFGLGCTVQELLEAILVAGWYTGGLRTIDYGIQTLDRVVRERGVADRPTPYRRAP